MYLMNYAYLWLLLLPLAVWFFLLWQERQNSNYFSQLGQEKTLSKLVNYSPRLNKIKNWLLVLSVFFLVVALLRPQWGLRTEKLERRGLDLLLVLDVSASMFAEDIQPSRLDKSVMEIGSLLNKLQGDRVGLITFSGSATPVCPLTTDYGAVEMFLKSLKYYQEPVPGTNLEKAFNVALTLFDFKAAQDKVLLIFTDGENHEGDLERIRTESRAKNIIVVPVAVGTAAGQPVPQLAVDGTRAGYKKDKKGQIVISHVDLAALKRIAVLGPYQLDSSEAGLGGLLNDLQQLKRAKLKALRVSLYAERYQGFLFLGLLFLVAYYLLSGYEDKLRKRV